MPVHFCWNGNAESPRKGRAGALPGGALFTGWPISRRPGPERKSQPRKNLCGPGLRWILVLGILWVTGCAVGPDYKPPHASFPSNWQGVADSGQAPLSTATDEPVTLVEWWKSFNDPTLSSLVARAIQSNPDIRQATARIRQARAARGVGSSALWPGIDASGAYRRIGSGDSGSRSVSTGSLESGDLAGGSGGDRDLFDVGLDAAWELDIFGGTRRNVEALSADLQAAIEDRRDVLVSLAAEVAINYINLRGLQQQMVIARENLEAQQKSVRITQQLFDVGFVSGLDVTNARAQYATTASQIPQIEAAIKETIYNLSVLLSREPTALVEELEVAAPLPLTPPSVPVGLPSDLLRRRPDMRRVEAQVHAATARIGVATADLYPKFTLTGSLSFTGEDLGSMASWTSRSWGVGPGVRWPVFSAGRIRWNIEVQKAVEEQTLLAYEKTLLTALKDVETALAAYAREQERLMFLEEAVARNRRAVELATELYTGGQTDFLNVLSAQRSLFVSEEALVQSTRNVSLQLVALYKALGGGWETTDGSRDFGGT